MLLFSSRSIGELAGRLTMMGENGPLYYVLMHWWLAVAGTSELALRYPALIGGVVGAVGAAGCAEGGGGAASAAGCAGGGVASAAGCAGGGGASVGCGGEAA